MTGKLDTCQHCKEANQGQKDTNKETANRSTIPGECWIIDISSVKHKAYGGSMFWLGMIDDCTNYSKSEFLKKKSQLAKKVMRFLRKLKKRGINPKKICMDNAGENMKLIEAVENSPDLEIEFELTPRGSPQFAGKIEHKFVTLWSCV